MWFTVPKEENNYFLFMLVERTVVVVWALGGCVCLFVGFFWVVIWLGVWGFFPVWFALFLF